MSTESHAVDQRPKTSESPDLLPCPFCGDGIPCLHEENFPDDCPAEWVVTCWECEFELKDFSEDRAVEKWNRRSPAAPTHEGGLAIQDVLDELASWRDRNREVGKIAEGIHHDEPEEVEVFTTQADMLEAFRQHLYAMHTRSEAKLTGTGSTEGSEATAAEVQTPETPDGTHDPCAGSGPVLLDPGSREAST